MRIFCVLLVVMVCPLVLLGQGVEELRASVVKITSKAPEGQSRTGTGFIVHVDGEVIYIATASHVVEGDPKPQVTFYHDRRRPVAADIGELERDNPIAGLGFLFVRDRAVAEKVKALRWGAERLKGGEDILTIGFGQGAGEWGVIKGTVTSASGADVRIDGRIEQGNSGGPILMNGNVVGMVTSTNPGGFGVGKSGSVVQSTLRGWEIEVSAPTTAGSGTAAAPATPNAPSGPAPSNANVDTGRPARGRAPSGRGAGGGPRWRSYDFPPPNAGMVVFTIMPDGNTACASYDAAQCLWGIAYDQIDFTKVKPLVCGDGHRAVWGATGYEDPKHWCNLGKQAP